MSTFGDLFDSATVRLMGDYGDVVTYGPRAGDSYTLTCVLDSGEAVQQGERVYLTAWAPLADFTGGEPAKGDTVVINSVNYRVADVEKQHFDGRLLKLAVTN